MLRHNYLSAILLAYISTTSPPFLKYVISACVYHLIGAKICCNCIVAYLHLHDYLNTYSSSIFWMFSYSGLWAVVCIDILVLFKLIFTWKLLNSLFVLAYFCELHLLYAVYVFHFVVSFCIYVHNCLFFSRQCHNATGKHCTVDTLLLLWSYHTKSRFYLILVSDALKRIYVSWRFLWTLLKVSMQSS